MLASEKVAGILAAIAVFTVTSVLVFALGAPWFFVVIAIILSLLVGRLIAQQPWKFEESPFFVAGYPNAPSAPR